MIENELTKQQEESGQWLSLSRSHFPFLDRFMDRCGDFGVVSDIGSASRLAKKIESSKDFQKDYERRYREVASGAYYWYMFLVGFVENFSSNKPQYKNSFFLFLKDVFEVTNFDPSLKRLFDEGLMPQRVGMRFDSFYKIMQKSSYSAHPVLVFRHAGEGDIRLVDGNKNTYFVKKIDGYHRIFSGIVCGIDYMPFAFFTDNIAGSANANKSVDHVMREHESNMKNSQSIQLLSRERDKYKAERDKYKLRFEVMERNIRFLQERIDMLVGVETDTHCAFVQYINSYEFEREIDSQFLIEKNARGTWFNGLTSAQALAVEVTCLIKLGRVGPPASAHFPKVYSVDIPNLSFSMSDAGISVKDRIKSSDFVEVMSENEQIKEIIAGLKLANVIHLDMHSDGKNLTIDESGKLSVIDFDVAVYDDTPQSGSIRYILEDFHKKGGWDYFERQILKILERYRRAKDRVLQHKPGIIGNQNSRDGTHVKTDMKINDLISRLNAVRDTKKTSAEYKVLAQKLYVEQRSLLTPYWSEDYDILRGGASNLFTAKIFCEGKNYFLKVTKKHSDSEYHFYNLLMDGSVPESGDYFSFIKPNSIASDAHVRAFVFPFVDFSIVKYSHESVAVIIKGLAEVTSLNFGSRDMKQTKLKEHPFKLSEDALNKVVSNSIFDSKDEERTALKRHEAILSDWAEVTSALMRLDVALCNRDARQENMALIDGKLTLFDMGAAALAPAGADLYQIIHEVKKFSDRSQICRDYTKALGVFGVHKSPTEIEIAACAASAYKWMNVSEKDTSTLKAQNYLYALECAEFCTRACRS